MAIDKSKTKPWVKVVLIVLIIAFVTSFISISSVGLFSDDATTAPRANDAVTQANERGRNTIAALSTQLASDPESYTVLVAMGNSYFDWANSIKQASQTATAVAGTDLPIWVAAKDSYSRALAVQKGESPVKVDFAIVTFYSGDPAGAIVIAEKVAKDDSTFAQAWFNLGIFYTAVQQTDKAIAAYERYLKLDPAGKKGDVDFVKGEIATLKSGSGAATTTP